MTRLMIGIFVVFAFTFSAFAQEADPRVAKSLKSLKEKTTALGKPKIDGKSKVADKEVPILYFGSADMNNKFEIVDAVVAENKGTATLFVKSGSEYVRVSTNVLKDDKSRAIGTILDPNGKAIVKINAGESFFGEVTILEKPYITGYEPIKDEKGSVIGIWYVGFLKL